MDEKGWKIYKKVKTDRRKEGRKKRIRGLLHVSEENTGEE
jgi:hypothetical protein